MQSRRRPDRHVRSASAFRRRATAEAGSERRGAGATVADQLRSPSRPAGPGRRRARRRSGAGRPGQAAGLPCEQRDPPLRDPCRPATPPRCAAAPVATRASPGGVGPGGGTPAAPTHLQRRGLRRGQRHASAACRACAAQSLLRPPAAPRPGPRHPDTPGPRSSAAVTAPAPPASTPPRRRTCVRPCGTRPTPQPPRQPVGHGRGREHRLLAAPTSAASSPPYDGSRARASRTSPTTRRGPTGRERWASSHGPAPAYPPAMTRDRWRPWRRTHLGSEADRATFRTLHTASLAAPALREGLTTPSAERSSRHLRALLGSPAVALTDTSGVLHWDGLGQPPRRPGRGPPGPGRRVAAAPGSSPAATSRATTPAARSGR